MIETLASLLVFIGAVFIFSAALGLLRMPDALTRIQTATKATTLGAVFMLAGLAVLHPDRAPQYILLIVFVFISNPISSHALARAARTDAAQSEAEVAVTAEDKPS